MQLNSGAVSGGFFVLAASVLWGTTGTAASFIPHVGRWPSAPRPWESAGCCRALWP
ncbi:hypothetical protein [Paramicrobacterium humi]|uniref:hypothetical protein n=1 Tax=Paramicrobacterium humi TaxID=640635 RepID=UPI0015A39EF0